MSMMGGHLLREPAPGEHASAIQELTAGDYTLVHRGVKRIVETAAPVHRFEVVDTAGKRVGVASLAFDNDSRAVSESGHVCVTMSEGLARPSEVAELARALLQVGYDHGYDELRIVIPASHPPSLEACQILQPCRAPEDLELDGRRFLGFAYRAGCDRLRIAEVLR